MTREELKQKWRELYNEDAPDFAVDFAMISHNAALDEAIALINYAREEGETDLRSVRNWIKDAKIEVEP